MKSSQSAPTGSRKPIRSAITTTTSSSGPSSSITTKSSVNIQDETQEGHEIDQGEIVVALRVRPLSSEEINTGHQSCCQVLIEESSVIIQKKEKACQYLASQKGVVNEYKYDHVFDESISQFDVYSKTAKPLVNKVLIGFNATIFAYGATGAGKTYTMLGDLQKDYSFSSDNAGIIPNCVRDLIHSIKQRQQSKDIYTNKITISVSYFEVYNEQVYDLLDTNGACLSLREDQEKGIVVVAGATEIHIESVEQVMQLLCKGNRNRKTEATLANQVSSRSHAVFQLIVNQTKYSDRGQPYNLLSKLSLIDLAGSERASATNNRGIRLLEGANINKSLLALANCINALCENSHSMMTRRTNVKYRDSKLTHLLKSSLEGHCYLVMIANVNPSHITYEDSHNTLKYANRAKTIKINPDIKDGSRKCDSVETETRLIEENKFLRGKISDLENLIENLQKRIIKYEEESKQVKNSKDKNKDNSQYHDQYQDQYQDQYHYDIMYSPSKEMTSFILNPIRASRKRSLLEDSESKENRNINVNANMNVNIIPKVSSYSPILSESKSSLSPLKKLKQSPSQEVSIQASPARSPAYNSIINSRSPVNRSMSPVRSKPLQKRKSQIPRLSIRQHPVRNVSPTRYRSPNRQGENKERKLSPYGRGLCGF